VHVFTLTESRDGVKWIQSVYVCALGVGFGDIAVEVVIYVDQILKHVFLQFCQFYNFSVPQVYPSLDVRNVVESSKKVTINKWCGFGHNKCHHEFTVRPFRCLG